jgi:hypothetical protein
MYNNFFESIENMIKLFKKEFNKNITKKSFYENWIKKYIH